MSRLELARSPEDPRLYVLPGVGELRTGGLLTGGRVEATAGGRTYTFATRGRVRRVPTATDAFGEEVGQRSGSESLVWRSTPWDLRPSFEGPVAFYALARPGEEREVARLLPTGWGKRPVPIVVDDSARLDPGLVLFAIFVMRRVNDEMIRAAGSGGGNGAGGG
jgi:hypothetical protein